MQMVQVVSYACTAIRPASKSLMQYSRDIVLLRGVKLETLQVLQEFQPSTWVSWLEIADSAALSEARRTAGMDVADINHASTGSEPKAETVDQNRARKVCLRSFNCRTNEHLEHHTCSWSASTSDGCTRHHEHVSCTWRLPPAYLPTVIATSAVRDSSQLFVHLCMLCHTFQLAGQR